MNRKTSIFLTALLAGLMATRPANAEGRIEGSPVIVEGGAVVGKWAANTAVRAHLGIPFAASPTGALRWKSPQPVTPWPGVRPAVAYGPQCLQAGRSHSSVYFEYAGEQQMSEDCLTLNVWAPAEPKVNLPVMVWIYGGGFQQGSAANPTFDGTRLAERGVVVVSVNYRVGVFGFLAHNELTAESSQHASGNYGLLDQVAALQWVKRNIGAFGGDPNNVTIFGQSAGASSVAYLFGSPLARGLFHRGIAESTPFPRTMIALAEAEERGRAFAQKLGASGIAELRAKSGQEILDAKTAMSPIVDGWFLPSDIHSLFRDGKEAPVPLLMGWNANEGATFPHAASLAEHRQAIQQKFGGEAVRVSALYPATDDIAAIQASKNLFRESTFSWGTWTAARLHAKNGHPTFLYYFDHPQPLAAEQTYDEIDTPEKLGTFHSSEYPYIFGTLDVLSRAWSAADRALSIQLQSYWINYARAGTPNGDGMMDWPRFMASGTTTMHLGDRTGAAEVPNLAQLRFFDEWLQPGQ
jgi:para-nitrobenzyl esterase